MYFIIYTEQKNGGMEKPPFGDGFSIICIRKPNSVYPVTRERRGLATFIWDCCHQQPQAALFVSPKLSSVGGSTFTTTQLRRDKARPCTQVRIQPFHFHVAMKLFYKRILAFRHWRHCSHLYGYPRRALPATLLHFTMRVFGLSSVTKVTVIARCTNKQYHEKQNLTIVHFRVF